MPRSRGWCAGPALSVDGTFVEANASTASRIPREQLMEAAQVNRTVREYLAELEITEPSRGADAPNQDKVSTTDSGLYVRDQMAARRLVWGITTIT